jgi:hypothetical protein
MATSFATVAVLNKQRLLQSGNEDGGDVVAAMPVKGAEVWCHHIASTTAISVQHPFFLICLLPLLLKSSRFFDWRIWYVVSRYWDVEKVSINAVPFLKSVLFLLTKVYRTFMCFCATHQPHQP